MKDIMKESRCYTCRRDYSSSKKIACLSNLSPYAKEIKNAESAYESEITMLAQNYGISTSIPSSDPISEIKSRLIAAGHEDEVSEIATKILKGLDPLKRKVKELGMVLSKSEPFNYIKPFDVIECPSYKLDSVEIKHSQEKQKAVEGLEKSLEELKILDEKIKGQMS